MAPGLGRHWESGLSAEKLQYLQRNGVGNCGRVTWVRSRFVLLTVVRRDGNIERIDAHGVYFPPHGLILSERNRFTGLDDPKTGGNGITTSWVWSALIPHLFFMTTTFSLT
jgi:hypothetical protein